MEVWNFEDCITQEGNIDSQCASYVSGNKYRIHDHVMIRTKGQLVEAPNIPFTKGRSINTDFKLDSDFYFNKNGSIQSECVTPIHMEYHTKKIYDFKQPTRAVKQGTNKYLVLGQELCSKDYFKTFVYDYNRV